MTTFEEDDVLQRKAFAERLTDAIRMFHPFADEAYVLSLNAPFGSGKTIFLKKWEQYLKDNDYQVISINAWETDFADNPIVPIVAALLGGLPEAKTKKLKDALKEAAGAGLYLANGVVTHATGVDIIGSSEKAKVKDLRALGNDLYKGFDFQQEANKKLKIALEEYAATLEIKPLIILVDELDRARPDYAIHFLEAIKHLFSVPNIAFVLAVDKAQLKSSARVLFGSDIDFDNYYRRFVTREADLQIPEPDDFAEYIQSTLNDYFGTKEAAGLNFCTPHLDKLWADIYVSAQLYGMRLRGLQQFFNVFVHFCVLAEDKKAAHKEYELRMAIFLIATYVADRDFYHQLGKGDSGKEICAYLESLIPNGKTSIQGNKYAFDEDLFSDHILYAAFCEETKKEIADLYMKWHPEEEFINNQGGAIAHLSKMDNYRSLPKQSTFMQTYKLLENWRTFIE